MDAETLLEKYAAGERQFHNENLRGVDLKYANLSGIEPKFGVLIYLKKICQV
jgi:2-iminobutanoate/2-iminopropanoate deaminase